MYSAREEPVVANVRCWENCVRWNACTCVYAAPLDGMQR